MSVYNLDCAGEANHLRRFSRTRKDCMTQSNLSSFLAILAVASALASAACRKVKKNNDSENEKKPHGDELGGTDTHTGEFFDADAGRGLDGDSETVIASTSAVPASAANAMTPGSPSHS